MVRGVRDRSDAGALVFLRVLLAWRVQRWAALARVAEDEPGVARVSLIEGDASYLRGDADDWTGVAVNAPLVTGDRFYSGADSRAEIQLDPAVYARLSSETEVSMLELGPDATQVRMSLGLATFRVRAAPASDTSRSTRRVRRSSSREGGHLPRDRQRNGDTNVQVRDGAATVYVAGEHLPDRRRARRRDRRHRRRRAPAHLRIVGRATAGTSGSRSAPAASRTPSARST